MKSSSRDTNILCHFHFLRDLGKDLLKKDHSLLVSILRDFGVKTTLSKFARELRGLIQNYTSLSQHLEQKTINLSAWFKVG